MGAASLARGNPLHDRRHPSRPHHHPRRRFRRVVSGSGLRRRYGRRIGRARLHGDQAVGLRHLGTDAAPAGRPDQGSRRAKLLFPAVHPLEQFHPRSRACGRFRQGNGRGHASPADFGREGRPHPRSCRQAGRTAGGAAHFRNHYWRCDGALGAKLARSAADAQPMGQCRALGNADADVPAHVRIPLAGRPYRA